MPLTPRPASFGEFVVSEDADLIVTSEELMLDIVSGLLRILLKHPNGPALLRRWYDARNSDEEATVFVANWIMKVKDDHLLIAGFASEYFCRSILKFSLGFVLCSVPPAIFVYLLPALSNPLLLAAVCLLTCILIPVMTHMFIMTPAKYDFEDSQILEKMILNDSVDGRHPQAAFFNPVNAQTLFAKIDAIHRSGYDPTLERINPHGSFSAS